MGKPWVSMGNGGFEWENHGFQWEMEVLSGKENSGNAAFDWKILYRKEGLPREHNVEIA